MPVIPPIVFGYRHPRKRPEHPAKIHIHISTERASSWCYHKYRPALGNTCRRILAAPNLRPNQVHTQLHCSVL